MWQVIKLFLYVRCFTIGRAFSLVLCDPFSLQEVDRIRCSFVRDDSLGTENQLTAGVQIKCDRPRQPSPALWSMILVCWENFSFFLCPCFLHWRDSFSYSRVWLYFLAPLTHSRFFPPPSVPNSMPLHSLLFEKQTKTPRNTPSHPTKHKIRNCNIQAK